LILKSEDFIKATEIVYKKTRFLVQQVLSNPIVGGNIDQIITVGGSTKSELIQSWLKYDFPEIVINTSMNPDESVALGAAIQAKRSKFGNDSITILDCLAMNIGVLSSGYITSILSAGDQIPCSNFKLFTTMEKGQKQVALDVYQGLTRFPEECTYLGTLEFNDLQVDEDKLARIVITLLVDSNGLLSIEAEIPGTGMRKLELVNVNGASKKNIDDKKLVRWRRFAKTLNEEDRESLLNMISRFSEGSLEEKEIVSFIQKHKKAIV
jgi:molecular chaperone DnaK